MTESTTHSLETDGVRVDEGFECTACGNRWYYTRRRCSECGVDDISRYDLTRGTLVTRTEVHATPPDVRRPNRLGLARFGDVHVVAQLGGSDIAAGDRVEFVGTHRLRDRQDATAPRLTVVED